MSNIYFDRKLEITHNPQFPEGEFIFDEGDTIVGIRSHISNLRTKKYRNFLTNANYFCAAISWNNGYTLTYDSGKASSLPDKINRQNLEIFERMTKYPGSPITKGLSLFYCGKLFEHMSSSKKYLNFVALSAAFYFQIIEHFDDPRRYQFSYLRNAIYHPQVASERDKKILIGMNTRSIKHRKDNRYNKQSYSAYLDLLDMDSTIKIQNRLRTIKQIAIELITKKIKENRLWCFCLHDFD